MTRLRLALLGAGRIAQDYVLVLEQSRDCELVAVVDPDADARRRAAALALTPTFASTADLLRKTRIDAALVLTPPATHAPLSLELLRAGCHVFCEKPLALSTRDAETMLAAAAETRRTLMMATKFRFVADVAEARALVAAGALGPVAFYANTFCSHVAMAGRWNADPAIAGGGVLIDNGTHSIDLARFLIGPLARVTAAFGPRVQPLEVEDTALLTFETECSAIGRIELSWSIDRQTPHYVEIFGARGALQIGWTESRWRGDGDWVAFGGGYDKRRAFAAQLAHFAAVCREECAPLVDGQDALASVRIVEAAYRAARNGTWEDAR